MFSDKDQPYKLFLAMAATKEMTVEDKLRALYNLQLVDSRIDELKNLRGELPLEVQDLEDEIEGLNLRVVKFAENIEHLNEDINSKKNTIENANMLIKRYSEQQKNVRNNREYTALTKEIEYQQLEIEHSEKIIKNYLAEIEQLQESVTETKERIAAKSEHLKHKKSELESIMAETQKEEDFLVKKSEEFKSSLDERLIKAYDKIRSKVKNGLAVVPIERGASAGSFFMIPPQVQMEIASRKRIITDEHSGRILIDPNLADEQQEALKDLLDSVK